MVHDLSFTLYNEELIRRVWRWKPGGEERNLAIIWGCVEEGGAILWGTESSELVQHGIDCIQRLFMKTDKVSSASMVMTESCNKA